MRPSFYSLSSGPWCRHTRHASPNCAKTAPLRLPSLELYIFSTSFAKVQLLLESYFLQNGLSSLHVIRLVGNRPSRTKCFALTEQARLSACSSPWTTIKTSIYQSSTHTLMDMHTDLTAVPHAGLGFHFLRTRIRTTGASGSSKRKNGQRLKTRSVRQGDGVPCVTAAALALYQNFKNWQARRVDQTRYPVIVVASLGAVPQSRRTPLL